MLSHKFNRSLTASRGGCAAGSLVLQALPTPQDRIAHRARRQQLVTMSMSTSTSASADTLQIETEDNILRNAVKHYYSTVLSTSSDLKTSACTACKLPSIELRALMTSVPKEVLDKFYGCGNAIPLGIQVSGVMYIGRHLCEGTVYLPPAAFPNASSAWYVVLRQRPCYQTSVEGNLPSKC